MLFRIRCGTRYLKTEEARLQGTIRPGFLTTYGENVEILTKSRKKKSKFDVVEKATTMKMGYVR